MDRKAPFEFQPTLSGPTLALRPLRESDFDDLYAIASDPLLWELHPQPDRWQRPVFEKFFAGAVASRTAFLVVQRNDGNVMGTSRYYEWDPVKSEVVVGHTFLGRSWWGTGANRELKDLMLEHAFHWVETVRFLVGTCNLRSRRAMEKLGGKFLYEGVKEISGAAVPYICYGIDRRDWMEQGRQA